MSARDVFNNFLTTRFTCICSILISLQDVRIEKISYIHGQCLVKLLVILIRLYCWGIKHLYIIYCYPNGLNVVFCCVSSSRHFAKGRDSILVQVFRLYCRAQICNPATTIKTSWCSTSTYLISKLRQFLFFFALCGKYCIVLYFKKRNNIKPLTKCRFYQMNQHWNHENDPYIPVFIFCLFQTFLTILGQVTV